MEHVKETRKLTEAWSASFGFIFVGEFLFLYFYWEFEIILIFMRKKNYVCMSVCKYETK